MEKKTRLIWGIVAMVLVVAVAVFFWAARPSAPIREETEVEFLTTLFSSDTLPEGTVYESGVRVMIGAEEGEFTPIDSVESPWESDWMMQSFPNCTDTVRQSIYNEGILGFGLFPEYNGPEFVEKFHAEYRLEPEQVKITKGAKGSAAEYQVQLKVTGSPDYTKVVAKGRIQLDEEGKVSFVSYDGVYDEAGTRLMGSLLGLNDPATAALFR